PAGATVPADLAGIFPLLLAPKLANRADILTSSGRRQSGAVNYQLLFPLVPVPLQRQQSCHTRQGREAVPCLDLVSDGRQRATRLAQREERPQLCVRLPTNDFDDLGC